MLSCYEDREKVKASLRSSGLWGDICGILGIIFAILGIVADAINGTLGLESISWFLLAIAALVMSAICYIGWAVAWYLKEKK